MLLPIRPVETVLSNPARPAQRVTVKVEIRGHLLAIDATDTEGEYTRTAGLPIVEIRQDEEGNVALLETGEEKLNFEWSVAVEPEYDMPFLPDEKPMWHGADIYVRKIDLGEKFLTDELARKTFPNETDATIIYGLSACLSLHFDTEGHFESGGITVSVPDQGLQGFKN